MTFAVPVLPAWAVKPGSMRIRSERSSFFGCPQNVRSGSGLYLASRKAVSDRKIVQKLEATARPASTRQLDAVSTHKAGQRIAQQSFSGAKRGPHVPAVSKSLQ